MDTEGESVETRDMWDSAAEDWRTQVGTEGDTNRILNSDPVLWALAGNVEGLRVLDAGCGTGYLSKKLHDQGATVTGIDFSERMIALSRQDFPGIDFRVDSCETLDTVPDHEFDLLIANYVLMDIPNIEKAMHAFHRVLRPGGAAVLVFSHPCFPQGGRTVASHVTSRQSPRITYRWTSSYFEQRKHIDPPWGHFTSKFIWFHRPLSDYWKAFRHAGLQVEEFEEPRITEERHSLAPTANRLHNASTRPYSVAFRLRRPESCSN